MCEVFKNSIDGERIWVTFCKTAKIMDYAKILRETRKYIREHAYTMMDKEQRKLYLKSIQKLISDLDKLNESSSTSSSSRSYQATTKEIHQAIISQAQLSFH